MRLIVVDFACVLCYPKTWKTQVEDPGLGFDLLGEMKQFSG